MSSMAQSMACRARTNGYGHMICNKNPTIADGVVFMYLGWGFVGNVLIGLGLLKLTFSVLRSSILVDKSQALNILEVAPKEGLINKL